MTILLVEHGMRFLPGLMGHVIVLDFGSGIGETTPAAVQRNAVA